MTAAEYTQTSILSRLAALSDSLVETDRLAGDHDNRLDAIESLDIEGIESRLTDIEGTVNDIDLDDLSRRLDDIENTVESLPDLEDIESESARNATDIENLEERIVNIENAADMPALIASVETAFDLNRERAEETEFLRAENANLRAAVAALYRIVGLDSPFAVNDPADASDAYVNSPGIWDAPMCAAALNDSITDSEAA